MVRRQRLIDIGKSGHSSISPHLRRRLTRCCCFPNCRLPASVGERLLPAKARAFVFDQVTNNMSTAQKIRPPKQQQAVWTETKSLNAVKSIIRTSISQICYLRALFAENCFSVTPFAEDVSVHALTPAKEVEGSEDLVYIDDDAWALTRWLEEGVFVALEKQYLKKMAFCIYTDPGEAKEKPKTLVESCE